LPSFAAVLEDSAASAKTLGLSSITGYGVGGGSDESGQTLSYSITAIPGFIELFKADGSTSVTTSTSTRCNATRNYRRSALCLRAPRLAYNRRRHRHLQLPLLLRRV
jgi:hypothetical protein